MSLSSQPCQEVWRLPLVAEDGSAAHAQSVLVDPTRCLLADHTGKGMCSYTTVCTVILLFVEIYYCCSVQTYYCLHVE